MISSNMIKNKRLLYILFLLSSLIPLPLPLCSSKLDHPSPPLHPTEIPLFSSNFFPSFSFPPLISMGYNFQSDEKGKKRQIFFESDGNYQSGGIFLFTKMDKTEILISHNRVL